MFRRRVGDSRWGAKKRIIFNQVEIARDSGLSDGERRLAAIMFTDIVGYTALTQRNESQAMEVLERHNRLLRPFFPKYHGREIKAIGDSFLVEFDSALDASRCATEIQSYLHDCNISSKDEWKLRVRIGIHLGDVIHRENDIFGDAVNIASRIQPIAEPEGICISQQVHDQVHNKLEYPVTSIGLKELKNVDEPTEVFRICLPWEKQTEPESSIDGHRIAVLPFASFSPDPNDAYFADGITDEIISTVSGISGLSVISRTSVMGYKGTMKKIEEIGRELHVRSILEGSFKKSGNRIRVTAELIDVARDKHLWAQNYDRNLDDVFAVECDVAKQVADALRVRILSPEKERIERKPTENINAYTLYLKGRFLWNKRGLNDVKKAVNLFEDAIREDPSYAPSYVGLADCIQILHANWGVELDPNNERAMNLLAKAAELDPSLAEVHATTGNLLMDDYHLREAEERFRKAIRLNPSYAFVHMWYHNLLVDQARWEKALREIEKAMELDPLSPVINWNHAFYYFAQREDGKALELANRVLELDPGLVGTYWLIAWIHGRMKQIDEMKHDLEILVGLLQSAYPLVNKAAEVWTAYCADDKKTVSRLLPELEAHLEETAMDACDLAGFHFYLGETAKGFEWLERSYSMREYGLLGIKSRDFFDTVRSDSRYLDLLKRLELDYAEPRK